MTRYSRRRHFARVLRWWLFGRHSAVTAAVFALLAIPFVASAQAAAAAAADVPVPGLSEYRIGPEDVLDISVWNNAELQRIVPVRPDGRISLPLVHDVQAAGLTPMELRDTLRKLFASYIPSPEVSVIVREVHSFRITVIGEVKRPGRFEVKSRTSVLEALAEAQGFTEFAAKQRIVIVRQVGTREERVPFDYNAVSSRGEGNVALRPGDIVIVP